MSDQRCVNATSPPLPDTPGEPTAEEDFVLEVDSTPAEIRCGFFLPQDGNHVQGNLTSSFCETSSYPEEGDILHIDSRNFENEMIDLNFWYQIEVSMRWYRTSFGSG